MPSEKTSQTTEDDFLPRMAPLSVPWKRRLQTAAVLFWGIEPALFFCIFLFLAAIPVFWPLAIAYVIWLWMDQAPIRGGRRRELARTWSYWRYFADYFPAIITKEADLDPSRNYLFGYHPHGIISVGAIVTFASEGNGFSKHFPGITPSLMTLSSNFKIPFHREYILALGMCDVSRQSCKNVLKSGGPGRSIAIVIGGASESLNARPGVMDLTLKKRLGFVRIALETGASMVPVLNFGENELYEQVSNDDGSWLRKLQTKTQRLAGFTLPLFHGRGIFNYDIGLLPHRRPMHVVFGEPIHPPLGVSDEEKDQVVRELHDKYMQNLKTLYDKYKDEYAPDRVKDIEYVE